jgi:hypothetical protein
MHVLFSLLRIKGLYLFRALLAHPQEGYTVGTWYIVCVVCQLAAANADVLSVNRPHVTSQCTKAQF